MLDEKIETCTIPEKNTRENIHDCTTSELFEIKLTTK